MTLLAPGTLLDGKYRIRELLGSGGMGAVYAAERTTLGDTVAVKCILSERNTVANRERFVREAQAAARIRHPNVVKVFDFGSPDGISPYMVMEHLEGPTLAQALRIAGRFSVDRALAILAQICSAVEAGHRRGVVHRDIKPGNVILARADDGCEAVKVLDFGLARIVTEAESEVTQPGLIVGTVNYMAPEQVTGGHVSPATDVFSLTVLLYEMVTGALPFVAENQVAMMLRTSQGDFDPPSRHVEGLPAQLVEAIAAGLSVDPAARPRSPHALSERAGGPASERGDSHSGSGLEALRRGDSGARPTASRQARAAGGADRDVAETARLDPALFVGRADLLRTLQDELEVGGEGRIALVVGEAGVGKSRLVDELLGRLCRETKVLRGRFFAYEGDRPPAYESLRWMLQGGDSGPDSGEPAMRPGVRLDTVAALGSDKWSVFGDLARQFVQKAGGRRLVLAIEDLQWATPLDLEFLAYLPHATRPSPVSIVGTARACDSEDLARWQATLGQRRALRTICVPPLTLNELRSWLRGYFGRLRIRPRDVRRMHHTTAGNPFVLLEVVRQLREGGSITQTELGWVCADLFDVAIPDSVHALFQARVDALDPEHRAALELGCVVGEQFRFETLQAAGGFDDEWLERALQAAVAQRILSDRDLAPGSDYRFTSEAVRRVVYDGLPPRVRRRQHQRVVGALRRLYADDNDQRRIASVLAYHHHAVGDWAATLRAALTAARDHVTTHDLDGAETALGYAQEAARGVAGTDAEASPGQRAQLQFLHGTLQVRAGRPRAGLSALEQAVTLALGAGEASLAIDAVLGLADSHLGRGQFAEGVAAGMRCINMAQACGDSRREYAARIAVARCAVPLGRLDDAEATLAVVLQDTDPEHGTARALALRESAMLAAKRGRFDLAVEAAHRAQAQAKEGGDVLAEYRAASALGRVLVQCGQYELAGPQLHRALELSRALSLRRREGIELATLGEVRHLSGDTSAGLELMHSGLAIFVETEDLAGEGDCRVTIGRMCLAQGRIDEALEMLEAGRRVCAACGRAEYEAIALCALGELRLQCQEPLTAQALYQRAQLVFSRGAQAMVWRAELGLARAAQRLGRAKAASAHAISAVQHVEQQLKTTPQGAHARELATARTELRYFIEDDSPTQTMVGECAVAAT